MADKSVVLTDSESNKSTTMPLVSGSLGEPAIDIGKLHKEQGYFTFDPGFMSTAATRSAITFIDGDKGVLLYRGYPIEQLAKHSSFLEVAYLLITASCRQADQFKSFEHEVTHHTMMHESLKNFLHGFHYDAHPMAMLCGSIASLSAFYHDTLDITDPEQRRLAAIRLIAKMPTIAAAAYRYSIGWPIRYPRNNLEYCTRFLHMMFEVPSEPLEIESDRWRRRSICCSSCTPIMSRTRARRRCAWSVRPVRIRMPASPPASRRCGDLRTAARTRRC